MTPKEKAKELFKKYFKIISKDDVYEDIYFREAKECALIVVEEMLSLRYLLKHETWFYKQVKKEIEKI